MEPRDALARTKPLARRTKATHLTLCRMNDYLLPLSWLLWWTTREARRSGPPPSVRGKLDTTSLAIFHLSSPGKAEPPSLETQGFLTRRDQPRAVQHDEAQSLGGISEGRWRGGAGWLSAPCEGCPPVPLAIAAIGGGCGRCVPACVRLRCGCILGVMGRGSRRLGGRVLDPRVLPRGSIVVVRSRLVRYSSSRRCVAWRWPIVCALACGWPRTLVPSPLVSTPGSVRGGLRVGVRCW